MTAVDLSNDPLPELSEVDDDGPKDGRLLQKLFILSVIVWGVGIIWICQANGWRLASDLVFAATLLALAYLTVGPIIYRMVQERKQKD